MSKNVEESAVDPNGSIIQADAEVRTSTQSVDQPVASNRPHNLRLPLFVFDCLLNLVSDQLVHRSISDRPADIVEDFTYQVMTAVLWKIYLQ